MTRLAVVVVLLMMMMSKLMMLRFAPDNVTFNDCSLEFGE